MPEDTEASQNTNPIWFDEIQIHAPVNGNKMRNRKTYTPAKNGPPYRDTVVDE